MTDSISSMWHSARHPHGSGVRGCWLPLWMLEQFLVLHLHCPLSFPLSTVWAHCYPTIAFHLYPQGVMGAHPSPRWPAGCYQASPTTLAPFLLFPSLSTTASPHFLALKMSFSWAYHQWATDVFPSIRQIHNGWHHWVKACAHWIPALLLRRVSAFFFFFFFFP